MADIARINQELTDFSRKLAVASNEYTEACLDAAIKRSDSDVAQAKAMLKAEGKTVSDRESEVAVICETVIREARISEAVRDALKERIRALQSVLNATQTRAAFLKAEMQLAGKDY